MTRSRWLTHVLSNVFKYLPPTKLFEVSKVNRQWRKAVKNFGVLRLNFSTCQNQKTKKYMTTLNNQLACVNCAHIRYIMVDSFLPLPPSVFSRIQDKCPNVIFFDYSKQQLKTSYRHTFVDKAANSNNRTWKKLRYLPKCHCDTAKSWRNHYADQLFGLYAHKNDFATTTVIKNNYSVLTLPSMPWLTTITINVSLKINERTINLIHKQCPSIVELRINNAQLNFHPDRTSCNQWLVPTIKKLTLDRITTSNFTSLLYLSLKYTKIQELVLYMNRNFIPPKADYRNEKKKIRRHLYLLISSLKHLRSLTVYLDDWYAPGSSVLEIWPGKEINEWRRTAKGQKVQDFNIKYGNVNIKLSELLK